jgi:integrin alpha FG-GAP repeat containing protein 1
MNIDAPNTTIRNVIPGNFLRKNLIDLLIVTSNEMQFYVSNESLNFSFAISIPIMNMTQPLVLDIDGDYFNDIIYNNATTEERMVAIYNTSSDNYSYIEFNAFVDDSCLTDDIMKISKRKLSTPHSSAFIDFDGDLYSDLMLLTSNGTNYMEIWTRSKKYPPRYCLNTENEIPANASQFSVEDMSNNSY